VFNPKAASLWDAFLKAKPVFLQEASETYWKCTYFRIGANREEKGSIVSIFQ
jgi:hypothetical protein